eukprot:TRINITY_DN82873_c0_g1_i1.p1 TRINITY_DN82873_c0_g1~~TRINITY_DN82873_c0_g1_i1.p1  ORF type:complete len:347 (-),score=92.23 TRINITY_DN82873_c0_g1_i1:64-1005(-)
MEKELLQKVLDRPSDTTAKAALLDHLLERDVRRPGLVASLARSLLQNGKKTSRLDQWSLREKLFVSLLDLHELDEASSVIEELAMAFPKSVRVLRLRGLLLECRGDFENAERLYESILEEDEANTEVRKRIIAIRKAQGRPLAAIRELNAFLSSGFACDAEAWEELCSLYMSVGDFPRACHCAEELVVLRPDEPSSQLLLAEIFFSLGGKWENFVQARKYYARCLELSGWTHTRAVMGLCLSCSMAKHVALGEVRCSGKPSKEEISVCGALLQFVYERMEERFTLQMSDPGHYLLGIAKRHLDEWEKSMTQHE